LQLSHKQKKYNKNHPKKENNDRTYIGRLKKYSILAQTYLETN